MSYWATQPASPVALCVEQVPRARPNALTAASSHLYASSLLPDAQVSGKQATCPHLPHPAVRPFHTAQTHSSVFSEGRACPDGSTITLRCVCTAALLVTASLSAHFNHNPAVSAEAASGETCPRTTRFHRHNLQKGINHICFFPPQAFILDSAFPVCGTGGTISPTRPQSSALARILGVRLVRRRS